MLIRDVIKKPKMVNCGCDSSIRQMSVFKQSSLAPYVHQWITKSTPLVALNNAYHLEQLRLDGFLDITTLDNFNEIKHKDIIEAIKDRYSDAAAEYVNSYRSLLFFLKQETFGWFKGTGA